MVELRKRKAHDQEPTVNLPSKKRISSVPITVVPEETVAPAKGNSSPFKLAAGDIIDINGFGGVVSTQTGEKTTLKSLLERSETGVILFTYPKASTPGCKSLFLPHLLCVFRCIHDINTHYILCWTNICQVPLKLVYLETTTRR